MGDAQSRRKRTSTHGSRMRARKCPRKCPVKRSRFTCPVFTCSVRWPQEVTETSENICGRTNQGFADATPMTTTEDLNDRLHFHGLRATFSESASCWGQRRPQYYSLTTTPCKTISCAIFDILSHDKLDALCSLETSRKASYRHGRKIQFS